MRYIRGTARCRASWNKVSKSGKLLSRLAAQDAASSNWRILLYGAVQVKFRHAQLNDVCFTLSAFIYKVV